MLTFYYHPLSPIARRVWLALLEKDLQFEGTIVDLRGEQNKPEFLALNPFHHVPVIVDDGFKLIESLAILEYLEGKYPEPSLTPELSIKAKARSKMIQMVTVNELVTKFLPFVNAPITPVSEENQKSVDTIFGFLEENLREDEIYFGGGVLNHADIVVGATVPLFCQLGVSIAKYPRLDRWHENITKREAWQKTKPSDEDFQKWQKWIQLMIKRRNRK